MIKTNVADINDFDITENITENIPHKFVNFNLLRVGRHRRVVTGPSQCSL